MAARHRWVWGLAALISVTAAGLAALQPRPWRLVERGFEAQLLRWRGSRQPPPQLLLVEIDDATLQQGDWFADQAVVPEWARGIDDLPWPRARYGDLLDRLLRAGASAIAINVVFEGPSLKGPDDDAALTRQLGRWSDRVVLAAEMLEPQDPLAGSALTLVQPDRLAAALARPLPIGLSNIVVANADQPARHPEHYGRRLLPASGAAPMPSLAARLLQQAGVSSRQNDAERLLNFYGPAGQFRHVSAWQVLDPARWALLRRQSNLAGTLVLVGPVSANGTAGFETPFGRLSGLEVMATAIANSLDGSGLLLWPAAPWSRGLLALLPLLGVLLLARLRTALAVRLLAAALALALIALTTAAAWSQSLVLLPALAASAGVIALVVLFSADAYLGELAERRRLRRTFERYVAPTVVREILADPRSADGLLQGKAMPVTVLFSDIKGFTQMTQRRTRDGQIPLHLSQLNTYLGAMVEVITAHGGTIDKFIGDCVMAVFGSPISRGQQAEALAAVHAAIAMAERLNALNAEWAAAGLEPFFNGVGLATGEAAVGQIGSPQRLDFTVIGDTVNLAARLESLTRVVETPLLVDRTTAELVAAEIPMVSAGVHSIKGIGEVEVFRR
ncbi:MAG: adenylate/guanylate cyclase domain-containing protein [Cyanobacteria bacterium K_DeepCast_35m_m2_023]|nr:adenylate/guanylate cyclase domain-containing protein [Cyanobacteria bacterium K_DeepCast_35m_m2_023]